MRSIRFLNLRRLREQPVRSLLAVVAIAAGTTLLVAVLIDRASVNQSFDEFVTQRAGPAKRAVSHRQRPVPNTALRNRAR